MLHGFGEYTTGRIRLIVMMSLMTLDISVEFLQSHAAIVQVCASAFTLMHFKKAYITRHSHTHS